MTTLQAKAQKIIEASKPQGFMNLVESETRRPRRDGLTTNLIELAKKMKYRFVVASKAQADHLPQMAEKPVIASASDFRGMNGGFIWDHYSVAQVCWDMCSAFDRLKTNAADISNAYMELLERTRIAEREQHNAVNENHVLVEKNLGMEEKVAKLEAQLKVAMDELKNIETTGSTKCWQHQEMAREAIASIEQMEANSDGVGKGE